MAALPRSEEQEGRQAAGRQAGWLPRLGVWLGPALPPPSSPAAPASSRRDLRFNHNEAEPSGGAGRAEGEGAGREGAEKLARRGEILSCLVVQSGGGRWRGGRKSRQPSPGGSPLPPCPSPIGCLQPSPPPPSSLHVRHKIKRKKGMAFREAGGARRCRGRLPPITPNISVPRPRKINNRMPPPSRTPPEMMRVGEGEL